MKVIGRTTRLTEEADLSTLIRTSTLENGRTTKLTDMGSTFMPMVLNMKDFGEMTNKKVKERNNGQMELNSRANISKAKSTD